MQSLNKLNIYTRLFGRVWLWNGGIVMQNIQPKFYSIGDVVKIFNGGISRQWIWQQIKDGKIRASKFGGRKYYIDARWIEEKEREIDDQRQSRQTS